MAIPVITEGEINAVKKNAAHARRIGKADTPVPSNKTRHLPRSELR